MFTKMAYRLKRTLACDELRGLLIASSKKSKTCFYPNYDGFDKVSNNN